MRWHRVAAITALLAGCGRYGFDLDRGFDAAPDPDAVRLSYADTVFADQPRAYYRLGDQAGLVVTDSAGNDDHANLIETMGGIYELARPGALPGDPDTAIRFTADGNSGPRIDAWAELPAVWPTWAGDFTVEVFARPLSLPPSGYDHSVFVCERYLTNGFRTGWDNTLRLGAWSTQAGGTGLTDGPMLFTLGEWHHLAFVRRGTTMEVFIDAQSNGSMAFDYIVPTSGAECGFGSFHGMPSDIDLDELAIHEVALTPAQIAAHLAAAQP